MRRFVDVQDRSHLRIENAYVPLCCIPADIAIPGPTIDSLALVDIEIADGCVTGIRPARGSAAYASHSSGVVDLKNGMVLPTFVDLHTHIGMWLSC